MIDKTKDVIEEMRSLLSFGMDSIILDPEDVHKIVREIDNSRKVAEQDGKDFVFQRMKLLDCQTERTRLQIRVEVLEELLFRLIRIKEEN